MELLASLWLPVVVSTAVLFLASFLAWAVLPHHRPDFDRWPDERRLLEFIDQRRPLRRAVAGLTPAPDRAWLVHHWAEPGRNRKR